MKRRVEDLAVVGGPRLFQRTLHVGRPYQGSRQEFFTRVEAILDRNWLTNNGPVVQEFERRIAEYLNVRHCIAVCNGTLALELAAQALHLRGEVIVPAFTFIATAHAFTWKGIRPVFADIDPVTHCIDPESVRTLITSRTSAIVGVHTWGHPCNVESLQELATAHGIALLFDAAHAFGVSIGTKCIGTFGDCETFSFHATKVLNSFEGGAVATNRDDIAEKVRFMRNFGFDGMDRVEHLGINAKMPEVCAAMGITSLAGLDTFVNRNRENQALYRQYLAGLPGLRFKEQWEGGRSNHHYVVITVEPGFGMTRDQLMSVLHAEGIRVRRYFWPGCHRMEPYRSDPSFRETSLQHTEDVAGKVLQLPSGADLSRKDISAIGGLLYFVHENASNILKQLPLTNG